MVTVKVKLQDIVDEMVMDFPDQLRLIHITSGKVFSLLQEFLTDVEYGKPYDDLPEWHQEQIFLAIDLLENEDNYISLPTQFDINEYGMMKDFCFMQKGSRQNELLNAIKGKGAFRRFKDRIYDFDLEDAWYTFRDECYQQIAIDFCKQHGLEYE